MSNHGTCGIFPCQLAAVPDVAILFSMAHGGRYLRLEYVFARLHGAQYLLNLRFVFFVPLPGERVACGFAETGVLDAPSCRHATRPSPDSFAKLRAANLGRAASLAVAGIAALHDLLIPEVGQKICVPGGNDQQSIGTGISAEIAHGRR